MATFVGRTEYNDRWPDWSPSANQRRRKLIGEFRSRLHLLQGVSLNDQDQLSRELFDYQTREAVDELHTMEEYDAVSHISILGRHSKVFFTLAAAPSRTVQDYEDILQRLRAIPQYVDGLAAAGEEAIKTKALQPKLVARLVVEQLDQQMAPSPDQSPLLAAFRKFPPTISVIDQERLRRAATEAYESSFRPAWRRYRVFVRDIYLPAARSSIGLADAFNGVERYRFALRRFTTTTLTAEQIHAIGQKEIARIQAGMAAIREELGFSGTAEQFVEKVLDAPEMRFKNEDEILSHGRQMAKQIDPELPRLFLRLPRMPYGVRAMPIDRARTAAAAYYTPPALDGTRAGYVHLSTYQPEMQSKCCMAALILHETVPGHHLQMALGSEMEGVPDFRRTSYYSAYGEGWGLYAETLGAELGIYETPYERYGQLLSELTRAVRLVVDTGVHAMGWSREKALELMRTFKGGTKTENYISTEVDRYIAWPGQAVAYKIGGLKIQELRSRAEKELGAKFDIREFHDAVLRNGPLPLELLERQMDRYIAANR
jgi:uncharacterized protein (DUF885 family)